jgi:hypothetical protein
MGNCFRCAADAVLGGLCGEHAAALAQCSDVTAEQIVTRHDAEPAGWLIDQWGGTHPIGTPSVVGRAADQCSVAILHHSVSALHAQLEQANGRFSVVDRGSLNGTFVNGERVRMAELHDGDRVMFGSVAFYVTTGQLARIDGRSSPGRTVPTRSSDLVFAARLQGTEGEIELTQRVAGGVARIGEELLELARLEFALVKTLVERRRQQPDPELCFVSSEELARALDFRSREADGENVRELVRRVRRKLRQAGVENLIESRQGVGYRVGWPVAPR